MKIYIANNTPIKTNFGRKPENKGKVLYLSEVKVLTEELFKDEDFKEWDEEYQKEAVKAVTVLLLLQKANTPKNEKIYKATAKYLEQIVEIATAELDNNLEIDPYINNVVSNVLIPLIDPNFNKRESKLQRIIYNDIYNFYLMSLVYPNSDSRSMIRALISELNYDIEAYEKKKK